MKSISKIFSAIICLALFLIVPNINVFAQEGEFTSSIQQPAKDTVYACPGENIVFIGLGHNSDGSAFDDNQVVFTWEFGNEETTMEGATVVFAFEEGGHYLVRLKVVSLNNSAAQNVPEIHIFVGMPPFFTGTRSDNSSFCSGEEITLTGFVSPNPWTGDDSPFENTYDQADFSWNGPMIKSDRNGIARAQPPLDEGHHKYIYRVKDDFGCFHDTIIQLYGLYAEYSFTPDNGEAPLEVKFNPKEVDNGGFTSEVTYLWEAYEISIPETQYSSIEDVFTFERPGQYITWMTASYEKCTFRFDVTDKLVRVDSSLLEIPNVFTPNEDGLNDFFQVKSVSLKSFSGRIFNRWGQLVYEWNDWKSQDAGWNGRNQGTGAESPSGTYYYIIEARGWDWDYLAEDYKQYTDLKKKKEERLYTGFVTLLR